MFRNRINIEFSKNKDIKDRLEGEVTELNIVYNEEFNLSIIEKIALERLKMEFIETKDIKYIRRK